MGKIWIKSLSVVLPGVYATSGTGTSAVIDLDDLPEGDIVIELHAAKTVAESGDSMASAWMHADSPAGPFTDSGLLFTAVGETVDVLDSLPVDRSIVKRYGKFVPDIDGATPLLYFGVSLTAFLHHAD
jgi:hypothetical protein